MRPSSDRPFAVSGLRSNRTAHLLIPVSKYDAANLFRVKPPEPLLVSARAWSELLHAEVGHVLAEAGIPCLHIKGPTVALWLYEPGERQWGDVDVLVPPSRMHEALAELASRGMVEVFPGVNRHTTTDHAVTVARREPSGLVAEVDVHDRFPGLDGNGEQVFGELWRRREPASLGHVEVWFPDLPTRALLVALNTARAGSAQSLDDLARLVAAAEPQDWEDVIALARRVQALPALRAGLELDAGGRDVVAATALAEVRVSAEWRLRLAGAPRTALRLDELRRLTWTRRCAMVLGWLFPPPAVVRMRDPSAGPGGSQLVLAYIRRFGDGMRAVPPSLRALDEQRRQGARLADTRRDGVQDLPS